MIQCEKELRFISEVKLINNLLSGYIFALVIVNNFLLCAYYSVTQRVVLL